MLTKFQKYINPVAVPGNIKLPNSIKGDIFLTNQSRLTSGLIQRLNVQPENLYITDNKERVGIHSRGGREYDYSGDWSYLTTSSVHNRKVRLYQAEINHMQSTPYTRKGTYVMQFENTGFTRSNSMLWARCSDDPYHRWGDRGELQFTDMQSAYGYARTFGFEVDIIYPHERYHEQKSYADNYSFQKEKLEDIENLEEISVENIEKRL